MVEKWGRVMVGYWAAYWVAVMVWRKAANLGGQKAR